MPEQSDNADPAEDTHTVAVEIRAMLGKLRRRLREASYTHGLPDAQCAVLMHLDRKDASTVTELAQAERMRPQSMGAIVAALSEAGLVSGTPDPNDGRRTILSLTAKARKAILAVRSAREDWLARTMQSKFSPAERRQLAKGVELLRRLVDETPATE